MGNLPYLLGKISYPSKDKKIKKEQVRQSRLLQERMKEYLKTIVNERYINDPYTAFYDRAGYPGKISGIVKKSENIRSDYRNKAAHLNIMSSNNAEDCYTKVIRYPSRSETYNYRADITGLILDLFERIDGNKLKKLFDDLGVDPVKLGQIE